MAWDRRGAAGLHRASLAIEGGGGKVYDVQMPQKSTGSDTKPPATVDAYIARLDEPRAALVGALRAVVVAAAPDARERVAWDRAVYSRHEETVCYIAAHARHVSIGFARGVEVNDPQRLLTGTGKRMRHIKCTALLDVPTESIRAMVQQAWGLAGA